MSINNLIKPPRLKSGDTVASVTLSWAGASVYPHRYEIGKKQFENTFGCKVIEMPHTLKNGDFIYNNPQARAEDLMQAFLNPEIKAIICVIGGDDSIRMLPYIDYDIIRKNPKIFMGYSDPTVTNFICLKAGIESYYGPSFMSVFDENCGIHAYTEECVRKVLFNNSPQTLTENKDGWTVEIILWEKPENNNIRRELSRPSGWKILRDNGSFKGHLIGGCMDVLDMINGTEIWPTPDMWKGAILFLETSEDAPKPDTVKYWLRNYGAQGILNNINGILFGRPGGHKLKDEDFQPYDDVLLQVLDEYKCDSLSVISRMDFGHTAPMMTLPVGGKVRVSTKEKTLTVL